jgi:ribonuclease HI
MPLEPSPTALSGEVLVHTDGACKGNPGPGGWGAVLEYGDAVRELFGGESHTTNNRMELTAVIEALRALRRSCRVHVVTDSQYVQQGVQSWLAGWKRKNWKTSAGKPVANRDLWEQLDLELGRHEVDWTWVRGHRGHPGNERADALANRGVESITLAGGESAPQL